MEPLLEGLLRSLGGSEADFLEVCFGRIAYGNSPTPGQLLRSLGPLLETSARTPPPPRNFREVPPGAFPVSQRKRDDNKNKICAFQGGPGQGGREENCPKRYFSWETS